MLKRLENEVELYKLHVKHYHMSPAQFRRRINMLGLPKSVYEKYDKVVKGCKVCGTSVPSPPRARISGMRASEFGDVVFVDHQEIQFRAAKYVVLLVLDGATNLLWATAQKTLLPEETISALRLWIEENNCVPKRVVGDTAFFTPDFEKFYKYHNIAQYPCGPRTPWPNRAETAVRLFKKTWVLFVKSLGEEGMFEKVTLRQAVKRIVFVRNCQPTVSGCSPLEVDTGRRPPDLLDVETSSPEQLSLEGLPEDRTATQLRTIAMKAHLEARQSADLKKDLAKRVMPSDGPYTKGEKVFVWHKDDNKKKSEGVWMRGTVVSQEGAMVCFLE